ncbi:DUF5658 family protein [Psychrobacillus sp. NPDC096389]|uniref:DUF5658 family protein n=1 Tax=Psychrobacillus sp. NPDC096389 TaxID=3364490 RepID=UPI00381BAEC5
MNENIRLPFLKKPLVLTFFLLLLAIFDSISTDFGIRKGHISEANPLMRFVYETNIPIFYSIKIILPLLFMYIITKLQPKKYMQFLIIVALLLYTFVLFQHLYWITIIISTSL